MEEFLKKLDIDAKPYRGTGGVFIVDIADSDEYGKIYSKLDKSKEVEEVGDSSQITYETASIQFESEQYMITLLADFDEDVYKMTIKEI